ncbi:MAG TPA: hypothetical protein VF277_07250 [Steroidobacteraceae bacterium]
MQRAAVCAMLVFGVATLARADEPAPASPLQTAEETFLATLDAGSALDFIDSGYTTTYAGRDRSEWRKVADQSRAALDAQLADVKPGNLSSRDIAALAAMRASLAARDEQTSPDAFTFTCAQAAQRNLDYGALRSALASCFVEIGNHLQFEEQTINRAHARSLLGELDQPERRKAAFDAMRPLWAAINGTNAPDSPYRRLIALAAADRARHGSEIDTAARAIGVDSAELERWLVRLLEAWSSANDTAQVEPWDFAYVAGAGSRQLSARIAAQDLVPLNDRYFADLGANLQTLGVVFDLAPRPDKSSVAYTDFVRRGRLVEGRWQPSIARVVATYSQGGLGELNELVHESGHAVHVSAIRGRPAYLDWPESLFAEAFADVPSWSVYEPAWQQRYLGAAIDESASLRALYGGVMFDVAWALFEIRMLQAPQADPNAVWTDLTHRYLHIVPHPEVAWWAQRVQLADSPGYMVTYGLGAVLTAEMRRQVSAAIGPFDAGNPRWYPWLTEHLLRFGSERDTRQLMIGLLGRPATPEALLQQLRRIRAAAP